jgi:spore maturation protein CgeB
MLRRGHVVTFYEKDVPYYASTRDLWALPEGGRLLLYESFEAIRAEARRELRDADLAMVTSYCPDGPEAARLILDEAKGIRAFYDMDTPVTLDCLRAAEPVAYLPVDGLGEFDLVLSYTGGRALDELQTRLGARRVAPLYGSVDPETHRPVPAVEAFRAQLSYLGTFAEDRQQTLEELFIKPARRSPRERFLIGGAQYPDSFPWTDNIFFTGHLEPAQHPAFFCSSRATLNVTRRAMAEYGYCPSGRLFEAAACGVPLLTDWWEGLDEFFTPGEQILRVDTAQQVLDTLCLSDEELRRVAQAARDRALAEHTNDQRVLDLERVVVDVGKAAVAAEV